MKDVLELPFDQYQRYALVSELVVRDGWRGALATTATAHWQFLLRNGYSPNHFIQRGHKPRQRRLVALCAARTLPCSITSNCTGLFLEFI